MAYDPMFGFNTTQKKTLQALIPAPTTPPGNATTTTAGLVKQAATQANFAGADAAAIVVELNTFLAKLKSAGIVA